MLSTSDKYSNCQVAGVVLRCPLNTIRGAYKYMPAHTLPFPLKSGMSDRGTPSFSRDFDPDPIKKKRFENKYGSTVRNMNYFFFIMRSLPLPLPLRNR